MRISAVSRPANRPIPSHPPQKINHPMKGSLPRQRISQQVVRIRKTSNHRKLHQSLTSGAKAAKQASSRRSSTGKSCTDSASLRALTPGLFSGVFVAQTSQNAPSDIYALVAGEVQALTENTPENELFPAPDPTGNLVTYLSVNENEEAVISVMRLDRHMAMPLFIPPDGYTLAQSPLAWSPDGVMLLVTLEKPEGIPGIYSVDLSNIPRVGDPELLIDNAASPSFAPNGRYIAFTRVIDGLDTIYVFSRNSGLENAVTEPGTPCFDPAFGKDRRPCFSRAALTITIICITTASTESSRCHPRHRMRITPLPDLVRVIWCLMMETRSILPTMTAPKSRSCWPWRNCS